ncbi:MAG: CBS domain-containing protein [Alphaproteobacteria bacterium]|nr:MAG: CBS domain-containing protein [Alphaproteobacteria bacterium]
MAQVTEGSSIAARGARAPEEAEEGGSLARLLRWFSGKRFSVSSERHERTEPAVGTAVGTGRLRALRVEDVAIPRAEIVAVPVDITLQGLVETFRESGYSRLPVYRGTLDKPVGLVHLKDLALKYGFNGGGADFNLKSILRPLLYVPPSMSVAVLLQKMQTERTHMALVIDEYGGVDGLVTIEDLIEEIIGEIEDEHDLAEAPPWVREAPGCYLVQAKVPLEEFERELGVRLVTPEVGEEVDTLGGLVFMLMGHVPSRGEVVEHPSGVVFEVVEADPRRIKRIRVRVPGADGCGDDGASRESPPGE